MSIANERTSYVANGGLRQAAARLGHRFHQYRVYRTTLGELQALSSRELADIGISRGMIRGIAYEAAYGG